MSSASDANLSQIAAKDASAIQMLTIAGLDPMLACCVRSRRTATYRLLHLHDPRSGSFRPYRPFSALRTVSD